MIKKSVQIRTFRPKMYGFDPYIRTIYGPDIPYIVATLSKSYLVPVLTRSKIEKNKDNYLQTWPKNHLMKLRLDYRCTTYNPCGFNIWSWVWPDTFMAGYRLEP